MTDFCFAVKNQHLQMSDLETLFGPFEDEPIVELINNDVDIFDILVKCKIFKSKSDAKKNWNKTTKEIPLGFTSLERLSKFRHNIFIWNAIE